MIDLIEQSVETASPSRTRKALRTCQEALRLVQSLDVPYPAGRKADPSEAFALSIPSRDRQILRAFRQAGMKDRTSLLEQVSSSTRGVIKALSPTELQELLRAL